ncbi:MAG: long-chain fatty acid--CoA ligase [Thermoplasmata archaeon]|nr:long-chain fatty acid--CoA ligase [Thermoplasmata archaeon]
MSAVASPRATEAERPWLGHYASNVEPHLAIPPVRLPELIAGAVRKWPGRTAFIFYGAKLTYAEFWEASGRFAAALARDGVGPGDRVALYLPNCPAYPIAFFGALRLGAVVVQVSPLFHGQDLARLLSDARPKAIVTLEILYPHLAEVEASVRPPLRYVARLREFYPTLVRPFVNLVLRRQKLPTGFPRDPEVRPWRSALRRPGAFTEVTGGDPATEVAVFQYTGGTTGRPKAAMLSHRNLVANAVQSRAWFPSGRSGGEVVLASVPFFHVYGMTVALNYPLAEGATIVLQIRPDVPEILKLVDKYHPTEFPGVPALYQGINLHPKTPRYRLGSIRVCLSGSAPLPREVAQRFEAITGGKVLEGYGLTEASPVTHANPVDGERRDGSIGLPLPETDQRIVDMETGTRELPFGEIGELTVRGPQVMLGYYGHPEDTSAVLRNGWLFTGDLARVDADGYAYIVDRKKDLINVGGYKVYPREVEEVLYQHPDIAEASVIGRPDARLGEVVAAFVVRRPGRSPSDGEIIEFVRKRLAHYKAPRTVEFLDKLPRSAIQKVLRRVLREAGPVAPPTPESAELPTGPA